MDTFRGMFQNISDIHDWMDMVISAKTSRDLGWNFPVELDAQNIVVPQLFD